MTSRFFVIALLVCSAVGCGEGSSTGTITGKVLVAGRPLNGGTVSFLSVNADAVPMTFLINEDGTYTATDIPQGELMVSVVAKASDANGGGASESRAAKAKGEMGRLESAGQPVPPEMQDAVNGTPGENAPPPLVPPKYQDPFTSDIKVTLDSSSLQFDVIIP